MAEETKYKVLRTFATAAGMHRKGQVVALTDAEAKKYNKLGAIGLHLEDGEEAEEILPKPKKRTGKPAGGPRTLDDGDMLVPDPKAK